MRKSLSLWELPQATRNKTIIKTRSSRPEVQPATLLKKRLWHSCFPVNFAKFLRTPFLQNTSTGCFWKTSWSFTGIFSLQKQPSRDVLQKRCSKNMQQIYRTPMPKCDFNNVALQLYWNHTSTRLFSCKFATYFQNTSDRLLLILISYKKVVL